MNSASDEKELQGSGHGLKHPESVGTSPGSLKKSKIKLKAAVAMRSLLNKLNITDRRKESFTDETSAASMIQGSITSHVPSKLSSTQTLDPTVNWLLDDIKCKENLSKTWSYFVNDLNEVRDLNEVSEASDCEKNIENQVCEILGPNTCHDELGYFPDESNDMIGNSTLVQRPLACRIKMGISVLQGGNPTKPSDSEISSLELKHRVLSQNKPASLPAISTDPRFGMPTFMGDHKDVLSQRSRRSSCPLAGSSSFLEASFSGIKPRIYDELPDHQSHFSFLPLKPAHTSKVSRPQCVNESYRSKSFMTASSSHMILQSPRNVPGASVYFQETIDESSSTGKGNASNFRDQQFLARQSSLQLLKATQCSNSTDGKAQLVSESTKSISLLKESRKLTCLSTPRLPTAALCPKFRVISDESAPTSQQVLGSQDVDESLYDAVVPDSSNLSSIMYSKSHASFLAVENNSHPSVGDITAPVSSFQAATTGSVCLHRNRWSLSDACRFPLERDVRGPPHLTLQNHQLGIASASSTIDTLAINSASHVPTAARTVRQVGSQDKTHVSLPKSARRCLHGNLKHQLPVGSLESNSMPKRAKMLECGKNEPASVSPSVYSKTAASVESQRSPNLGCNHPIATEASGSSYHAHKPPNYSLMNTVLKQTSRDLDKRPSNASLTTTDVCSFHLSELPETDVNGNYIALFADRSVLSPQTKQHLTPGYIIPAPLSTSSPMHHKRRLGSRHETLPPLPDLVSPVRHNPKPETHRAIPKDSNIKITKRQQHRNNRHNRFTVYENLDTSSDQEHGFGSPANDYILLTKTAGVIVNRIPFKKSIKPFINMRGLLEYLHSIFLSEMSKLPSGNIETISEYRAMKAEACQTLTPDQLTHETCLSELLVSVLVNEANAVEVCSDFIFKHLRFLSSCPDFYNVPPELFLMLLSNNKGIVLGYHGFPLPYEESVRQVQRAGRKYIQAHKTGSTERDSKLEDMLSFVIDQTSVLKSSHGQPDSGQNLFQNSYHEIKYRQSEQFVNDKISPCRFLPNVSLTAAGSLRASPEVEHSDPDMCFEKYCSNAYILRRIYFSYVIQDGVPYVSQIRQQYAVQGRKVTYSIGNSTGKSELFVSHRPANSGQNWTDSSHVCTTEASDSSNMVAAVPRTDQLVTAVAAGKSPASSVEGEGLTPEPAGLKMSAVQLTRGEHVTGVMLQGDSVLHNIMIITNKRRYIRAHGNVEFPGHTDWTLVPPPQEPKYCLQAIVANSRTASFHTYLQSVRVVWSVLSWPNKQLN